MVPLRLVVRQEMANGFSETKDSELIMPASKSGGVRDLMLESKAQ